MDFPWYIRIGSASLHPHVVFETLAYLTGFRLYVVLRRRRGDHIESTNRSWVIVAAIVGAALGSKLLYWVSDPAETLRNWNSPEYLMAGKTIVGGLIGGLISVELIKRRLGERRRTGDLFAIPLCVGIAVGRVGCFLSGLTDDTFGIATTLPWGVDFGDQVRRHPTQVYEIVFLAILACAVHLVGRQLPSNSAEPHSEKTVPRFREGDAFKTFMVGYLGFRLIVEFLKPGVPIAGLTAIQWACLLTLVYYVRDPRYLVGRRPAVGLGPQMERESQ